MVVVGILTAVASLVILYRLLACGLQLLQLKGLIAPQHVESSQTREQTPVPCIDQWILSHHTTRGSPYLLCVCVCVCVCFK